MKRKIVQFGTLLLTNLNLKGFLNGTIYKGPLKNICVPGLNCYSCPGALGSCPLGALQAVIGSMKYQISFYVIGFLTLFGIAFGRLICGWLCPFGLVQDLLYKIRVRKVTLPSALDRRLRYLKYLILLTFVLLFPLLLTNALGIAPPYFCQWICPSGTLFGGIPLMLTQPSLRSAIGFLFQWKMLLLILFLAGAVILYRPFCKYVCPLGAIYAFFNRFSFYQMEVDKESCCGCGGCEKACPMQVPVREHPNHRECIRCGVCRSHCPSGALQSRLPRRKTKAGIPEETLL